MCFSKGPLSDHTLINLPFSGSKEKIDINILDDKEIKGVEFNSKMGICSILN